MQFKSSMLTATLLCCALGAPVQAEECEGKAIYYAPNGQLTLYVNIIGTVFVSHLHHGIYPDTFVLDINSFAPTTMQPNICTANYDLMTGQVLGENVSVPMVEMPAIDALGNRVTVAYKTKLLINNLDPFTLIEIPGEHVLWSNPIGH